MANLSSITPAELLRDEFLLPRGIQPTRLAGEIGVPPSVIRGILASSSSSVITADLDHRLCHFFGLREGYWLRAQAACSRRS